ncbi:radical SAM family heme chaperone HemW [Roseibium album]|uniref:Heme chaperone HemW n=1 Tax=Roseibium album TaxID=311410 RepID=A0A0M6ZY97_9HYPH|nr:radical SAM family heme chaperone HemW [Roseibium album]MBG6145507.1 oxygen-independent coproporphyrinogen-3 oxidase [Labrenzia sp. EL_142]MBG6157800.1 oxygen-independent coproporphyrinogen-3 oxidase [Labrenzia sp. EL_162]MBG6163228.1 oxygen-independent coproporphyrinogen-3 oxidase [Labrenzia sp. EL_195]MBG6195807.1 oxygen-independent coproporphyrinogen-3 oxidase [Labrenzia sp. EL_159]MBG6209108.1 oxygen-independent coproporphyrinogen-3 oxidase [Labrenzia sp. EL_126]MCR9057816.1 radical SA
MTVQGTSDAGFGIYIHWPFCAAKCPYCDFNSHVRHQPVDQERFAAAFERELSYFADLTRNKSVQSIFLGGGTPSLMDPATVDRLLKAVSDRWSLDENVEITLEANPTSVEANRFKGYRAAGVNRVSLGVQSLHDTDLKLLGRLHDAATARSAIEIARETFPRLSFDLIYARPGQTPSDWALELEQAISLAADHLSLYQLTIEEGTPFFALHKAGKLKTPDPELGAEFFEMTQEVTEQAGLPAYEVSNHARPGAECRHNLVYWRYGDYVGIGPGAHGRLTVGANRMATATERHPETWLENVENLGQGLIENAGLNEEEQGDEFLLMGLRLTEGIDLLRYRSFSHRSVDPRRIKALLEHGMIEEIGENRVRATREGFFVLDAVVADLAA